MKILSIISLFLICSNLWAAPLTLNCTINKKLVQLNVEALASNGCQSGVVQQKSGTVNTRFNVTVCNENSAEGTLEVQTQNGWQQVEEFSTEKNCYLFRPVSTKPTPCSRFSHQC